MSTRPGRGHPALRRRSSSFRIANYDEHFRRFPSGTSRRGDRHPAPSAVTQDKFEEQMRERLTGDRHAEVGGVGEVDRCLAPGTATCSKYTSDPAMYRPPVAKPTLQRPGLALMNPRRIAHAQLGQHPFGFEHAFVIALE